MDSIINPRRGFFFIKHDAVNIAIAYYFVMLCFNESFSSLLPSSIIFLSQIAFYFLVLNALPCIARSFTRKSFALIGIYILIFGVSYAFAKDTEVFGLAFSTIARWCIPLFLLGLSVRDAMDLLKCLKIASVIILLFIYSSVFIFVSSASLLHAYSQDVGYRAIIPFATFLTDFVVNHRKVSIIPVCFSIIAVFIGGARGPLLVLIVGMALTYLMFFDLKSKKDLAIFAVIIVVGVVIFLFYQDIVYVMLGKFSRAGLSTRVLEGLLNADLSSDNSRDALGDFAKQYAYNHPLWGTGFINERRVIYDNLTINSNKTVYGYYCHNFFYEILMQFGLFPGMIIIIAWLREFFLILSKNNTEVVRILGVVVLCIGFLPLLVSYSYLTSQYFYLLVGVLLARNKIDQLEMQRQG